MLHSTGTSEEIQQPEPYAPIHSGDGFAHVVRPRGTGLANLGRQRLYDGFVRCYTLSSRIYFKLRFGGEIHYRWTFLSRLDIGRGDRVLEVSTGAGGNLHILPAGARLYGVDASPAMLRAASRHLKEWGVNAQLFQSEAEYLPFRSSSFDCVYHIGGLSDFDDPARAVREMVRVAKSGTTLLIADEVDRRTRRRHNRISLAKKTDPLRPDILRILPGDMLDVRYEEVCKGLMYRLTFRKP
ncbi:methyltransferase domain-containing protein [Saccharibacillus sp. CPCC 101409]|uniref:class I SAM-dependent methyltransferase n=1 Tax=Saccharibacillus sp. CPCC 101409 TaxID=3058041 RepID=UPI0026740544|nr:methyltransferase domain-containing protein [Saccharibacillus sp. CPCC 101409]MDO3410229.1 methyltransferase domain-containing protein [Saccharibacillus sp. CPCC 101409]